MKKFLEADLSQKHQTEIAEIYGGQTEQFFKKFNKNQAYIFKADKRIHYTGIIYYSFFHETVDQILDRNLKNHKFYLFNIKLIKAVKAHNIKEASALFTIIEEQLYYCEKCRIPNPFSVFLHSKDFVDSSNPNSDSSNPNSYSFYLNEPKYVNSFVSFFLKISGNNLCFDDLKVEDFIMVLKQINVLI